MVGQLILGLLTVYCISLIFQFRNIRLAWKTRLPYICLPISEFNNLLYPLFDTDQVPRFVNNLLPRWLADIINNNVVNYRWAVKYRRAKELGPLLLKSALGAANSRSLSGNKVLGLYGPNLLTCEDTQWAHHRRHTATTFRESNNNLVCRIAVQQTLEMIAHWEKGYRTPSNKSKMIIPTARSGILKLTLNVLCGVGFGVSLPFQPESRQTATDDIAILFKDTDVPPVGFTFTFRAVIEYMNSRLNAVVLENMGIIQSQQKHDGLTDSEIIGNLHIFTIAGHETTTTTFRFAVVLLAMNPDVQDWLQDCVAEATKDQPSDPNKRNYSVMFPRLIAPLCVMLETLRLYPPVVTVTKWTT
ncbi:hypothetical protein N8T08_001173 [Aspergillus melleus]|uniref:Uncharacterized protein n=1 Tax=Aspergillus melleus TaxID=138277 RepID=A0ACC3ANT8_9EURO|nr:hypothetical protein N8T08_001173 [Aspergillus melleus]